MLARLACSAARAELPVCYSGQSAVTASELGSRVCTNLFHNSCPLAASRPGPAPSHKSSPPKAQPLGSKSASKQLVSQQPDSAWTPVVHQQTGLTYYWNKSSGLHPSLCHVDHAFTQVIEAHAAPMPAADAVEKRFCSAGFDGLHICWHCVAMTAAHMLRQCLLAFRRDHSLG